jgi:hypothetical protein
MLGLPDWLIYAGFAVVVTLLTFRFAIIPFMRELSKAAKKQTKLQQEEAEEINVKNIGNVAGGIGANWINDQIKNLKTAHNHAMKLYAEQKEAGATPEVLKPLENRIKWLELLMNNEGQIKVAAEAVVKPAIAKFVGKIFGGLLS